MACKPLKAAFFQSQDIPKIFFTTNSDLCEAKSAFFSHQSWSRNHFLSTFLHIWPHFAVFFPAIHCQCSFFLEIFYFVCIFVCFQVGFADLDCPELQIGTALGQCRFVYGAIDSFAPKVVSFHLLWISLSRNNLCSFVST